MVAVEPMCCGLSAGLCCGGGARLQQSLHWTAVTAPRQTSGNIVFVHLGFTRPLSPAALHTAHHHTTHKGLNTGGLDSYEMLPIAFLLRGHKATILAALK